MDDVGRLLIKAGIGIAAAGVLLLLLRKLGLGSLPGDINYRRGGFSFSFPIVTCILISIVLSVVFNFFRK